MLPSNPCLEEVVRYEAASGTISDGLGNDAPVDGDDTDLFVFS